MKIPMGYLENPVISHGIIGFSHRNLISDRIFIFKSNPIGI